MIAAQGPHAVVSDLAIECEADVKTAAGRLTLELIKHGLKFQCQLDLSNGSVTMNIPGVPATQQPTSTDGGISRAGTYRLLYANVDRQLALMIGGRAVKFDKPTSYTLPNGQEPTNPQGGEYGEFSPAGIQTIGAAVRLAHLRVWRDMYYTFIPDRVQRPDYDANFAPQAWPEARTWFCFPPQAARKLAAANVDVQPGDQYFVIDHDQFVPLGDNSPKSSDARLWPNQHFVDRRLLVGKALFIYWPHSFDRIQLSDDKSIPFPFFPNFSRMGFVH
jgi:signal peptidase I